MAIKYAVASGNWSNSAIWNGGTLPTSADDVFANNFIVVIDQSITVLTLRNAANTTPAITAGGYFSITSSVTVTCSNGITQACVWQNASSSYLIQTSGTGITVNMNFSMSTNVTGNTNLRYMLINHTGILNFVGDLSGCGSSGNPLLLINNTVTANIVGNIIVSNQGYVVLQVNSNSLVNITGDIYTSPISAHQSVSRGLIISNIGASVYVIGNIYHLSTTTTQTPIPIELSIGNLYVTGNITGGFSNIGQVGVIITGNGYFNHTGVLSGGEPSNTSPGAVAVSQVSLGSMAIFSGPFIFSNYGVPPFQCTRLFLSSNTSKYIEFASNSTNGALFPSAAPTRFTMYSPNTIADSPVPANVRQGITYALGSQTGTLIVPSPSNVRKDIPTDNTVGTADLTAEDFLNAIETSSNDVAVRLRNVATVASTGGQLASYNV